MGVELEFVANLLRSNRQARLDSAGDGLVSMLVAAAVFGREQRHRHVHGLRHFLDIHRDAVFFCLVRHVEQQQGGQAELLELQGEAQLAFDLGGIKDDQYQVNRVAFDEMPYHQLVVGETVNVVNAG